MVNQNMQLAELKITLNAVKGEIDFVENLINQVDTKIMRLYTKAKKKDKEMEVIEDKIQIWRTFNDDLTHRYFFFLKK